MRNKELKAKIQEYENDIKEIENEYYTTKKISLSKIMAHQSITEEIKELKRYLEIDDITVIFSEILKEYIIPDNMIIEITNKPIQASSYCSLYGFDKYIIQYRNESKLHILGLSRKEFKYIKDKFETKYI